MAKTVEMACRTCKQVFDIPRGVAPICPNCKTPTLTEDWSGLLIIVNPKGSVVAENLGIKKPGRYAIRVGR